MDEFDYVVVGAGSAGSVVAARLSEDPAVRVLLLEAGPRDRHPLIHIPAAIQQAISLRHYTHHFETIPQVHLNGRRILVPRGHTLGGSSSINGMAYARGFPIDYDQWAQQGACGWSHDEVLPFLRKLETHPNGGVSHGADGPLRISAAAATSPLTPVFMEAAATSGYDKVHDLSTAAREGYGLIEGTYFGGRRQSTAVAYLRPARGRKNLIVRTGSKVNRVTFEGRKAVGVEVMQGSEPIMFKARREIILSSGAIRSPQLLMLSGIGPAEDLAEFGIPPLHDSPSVGKNLQDHIHFNISRQCTRPELTLQAQLAPLAVARAGIRYLLQKSGPMAAGPFESSALVRTRAGLEHPNVQFLFTPIAYASETFPMATQAGYMLLVQLLQPRSRGEIRLATSDPRDAPLIDPNYLADRADIDVLIEAVTEGRRILAQPAFDPYRGSEISPGCEVQSDSEVEACLREKATTGHHPVGTCRMGGDNKAVVDARLRVNGVQGLRVADASIMPNIVSSATNVPTIMIGEKAASMIAEDNS